MSPKFFVTILVLSILKLGLVVFQPILGVHPSGYDDRLFLKLAEFLYNGEWLGPYNDLTLIKGPIYPMWLAFSYTTGLPLHFTQQLLYLFAGLMLLMALKKLGINSLALVILYTLYLFNPMTETYVTRASIYPALSILVIASLIGLYASKKDNLIKFSLWAGFLGITLSVFWLTREESIWLLPTILLIIGYVVFCLFRMKAMQISQRIVISLLPLLILFGSLQTVSILNKIHYGVYTTTELKSDFFLSAYGAILRVKHEKPQPFIPLPKAVRQKIYAVSPTFNELKPFFEGHWGQNWVKHGRRFILREKVLDQTWHEQNREEIIGSIFIWTFRSAVKLAGYHQSGELAESYYTRLAAEINQACEQKLLDCWPQRATLRPPYQSEYLPLTMRSFLFATQAVIRFSHLPLYSSKHNVACTLPSFFSDTVRGRLIQLSCYSQPDSNEAKPLVQIIKTTMVKIYQFFMPLLIPIALLLYLFSVIHLLRFRQISFLVVLNTALLGAILARILIVVLVDSSAWPIMNTMTGSVKPTMPRYLVPVYPLLLTFLVLSVSSYVQSFFCHSERSDKFQTRNDKDCI